MKITVTKEDYLASSKCFDDPHDCPLKHAINRQGIKATAVGYHAIYNEDEKIGFDEVGRIDPPFYKKNFDELKNAVENDLPYLFETTFIPEPNEYRDNEASPDLDN